MMKIKDIMTKDVESCTLLDNVYEVAVKMKENDVGMIPIVDKEKIVGVITDRDIAIRGVAGKRPGSTKVEEIMSAKLITAYPGMSIEEASDLMAEHQIRRLPVVDDGKLVGMVALGDLAVREKLEHQTYIALENISEEHYSNKPI